MNDHIPCSDLTIQNLSGILQNCAGDLDRESDREFNDLDAQKTSKLKQLRGIVSSGTQFEREPDRIVQGPGERVLRKENSNV